MMTAPGRASWGRFVPSESQPALLIRSPDDALAPGLLPLGTAPGLPGSCGMTGNPQECREHAKKCLEKARAAETLLVMTNFESLAHTWLRLAQDLERAEALVARLKAPKKVPGEGPRGRDAARHDELREPSSYLAPTRPRPRAC
jgi:hypothetical protein